MALGRNTRGNPFLTTSDMESIVFSPAVNTARQAVGTLTVSGSNHVGTGGGGSGGRGGETAGMSDNWTVDPRLVVPDMDALLRRMREEVPEVELGRPPRERKISDDEKFTDKIYGMLSNGDPVSKDDMVRYLSITKKKRHIGRQERQYIHHPKDEDGKTTASISCDDITP